MDHLPLILSLALVAGALVLIAYPLWQQTRSEAMFRVNRSGQTLAEYQARYQATLDSIKDLMFDYEMGKVSAEDYELLLHKTKLEAAQIRQQIDRLNQGQLSLVDPVMDAEIESLVRQVRTAGANGGETLLSEIEAEIEALKHISIDPERSGLACPTCGKPYRPGDAFCTGCGQALPQLAAGCPACGAPYQPDDVFCAKCGAALPENVPA